MNAIHRLSSARDIREVVRSGHAVRGRVATVHARPRPGGGPWRATVVAGRRIGHRAVDRNRVKRRLREALRATGPPEGVDLVVVGRAAVLALPAEKLRDDVASLVSRALSGHEHRSRQ